MSDSQVLAQTTDSNYVNHGRNGGQDHLLGEIAEDVGGQIPISKTAGVASEYRSKILDYDLLEAYLGTLPQPRHIHPVVTPWTDPVTAPTNAGTTCAFFIQPCTLHPCPHSCTGGLGAYQWQTYRINGAGFQIQWNPCATPAQRHIFFGGPGGSSNAWKDWSTIDGNNVKTCINRDVSDWVGKPRTLDQEILNRGHIRIGIQPTYGHSVWSMLLRINDILWWLKTDPSVDPILKVAATNGRTHINGGSWAGYLANMALLFDPQTISGSYGGMMLCDFGYEGPQGGWRKLNGHRDAGIGLTVWATPMRGQNYPTWFGVEQMGIPGDFYSEDFTTAEAAAFSLLQRRVDLTRELFGIGANIDRHTNNHWSMDILNNFGFTDTWKYYQLMGHAEPGGNSTTNKYWYEDGPALLDAMLADTTPKTNPPLPTSPPVAGQQNPNPYLHTLSPTLASQPFEPNVAIPFALEQGFNEPENFGVVTRIGQGVFPGQQDTLKAGDWDGDGFADLIFGNFDGFVHRMEVEPQTSKGSLPLLKDRTRTTALGWGVAALDVGLLSGSSKWIVAGESGGTIWKISVSANGTLGTPFKFTTSTQQGRGPLANLVIGDFKSGGGNEVLVQDEFQRYLLFSANGAYQTRTQRTQVDLSKYTGMTGKASLMNQPHVANQELLLPCMDGYLRRLSYDDAASSLVVHAFPAQVPATLEVCLLPSSQGAPFKMIVGAIGNDPNQGSIPVPAPTSTVPFLAVYEINVDGATLLSTYQGPEVLEPIVSLKWKNDTGDGTFFVGSGKQVALLKLVGSNIEPGSSPGQIAIIPSVSPNPQTSADAPGFPVGRNSICGMEVKGNYVFVSTPSGRIFILNKEGLTRTRSSKDVEPWLFDPNDAEQTWQANLTLGWTLGTTKLADESQIYFLDSKVPFVDPVDTSVGLQYRIGSMTPGTNVTVDEIVSASSTIPVAESVQWNDLHAWREAATTKWQASVEVGDLWGSGSDLRLFQSFKPWFPFLNIDVVGGHAFARTPPDNIDPLNGLDFPRNFDVAIVSPYEAIPHGSEPKYRGQVSTEHSPNEGLYFGNSMKVGKLWLPSVQSVQDLLVVGTLGGFVYALNPSAPYDQSTGGLVYQTLTDLGWGVIGLDVGDTDSWLSGGDAYNEVVVGTWIDAATSADLPDQAKHRGNVIVLNPNPTTGELEVRDTITLYQDGYSPEPFGAGILGVKIDDVNNDGRNEIWCGDGRGYLYLLERASDGKYKAVYRSLPLGPYPGVYNNIHCVKDANNKTVRLIVFTSGYVYNLQINPGVLPW